MLTNWGCNTVSTCCGRNGYYDESSVLIHCSMRKRGLSISYSNLCKETEAGFSPLKDQIIFDSGWLSVFFGKLQCGSFSSNSKKIYPIFSFILVIYSVIYLFFVLFATLFLRYLSDGQSIKDFSFRNTFCCTRYFH